MSNSKLGHKRELLFFFFCLLTLDGKSLNPIPLLHFCNKKLNDDFKINLHMTDFSMASPPELHEIVFPKNYVIHNFLNEKQICEPAVEV